MDIVIEIIGVVASLFILGSLTFKCVSVKRNIIMRILNAIGALIFVVYGVLMVVLQSSSAWSLIVCNSLLLCFNIFHLIKLLISQKKTTENKESDAENLQQ